LFHEAATLGPWRLPVDGVLERKQPTARLLMVTEQLGPISAAPLPSSQRAL
jgi:hypothetical protein